jgi:DNA mismatch repair protein MutS
MVLPLLDKSAIDERLEIVTYFILNNEVATQLKNYVRQIGDLERLISKVPLGKINPREVVQLKRALAALQPIKEAGAKANNAVLNKLSDQINPCEILRNKIEKELLEEAPAILQKGNVIAEGVSKDLDELRYITRSGKDLILDVQKREVERTGISSLKVGFNNVFGYYLEVTNSHKDKVPVDWIHKQTLVNAERYITPELKEFEEKILTAEDKIAAIEQNLYSDLMQAIAEYIQPIQHNASLIAKVDCLLGFAALSHQYGYHKPVVNDSKNLNITDGRHPVIERLMKPGESYVSNSVSIDPEVNQVLMITGPNMSGKSALLRQTALIVMMAQIGCYVSAQSAEIGLVDKIFTRVGASDNLTSGESTFMVEMNETSAIMNNISDRSLILLDEIGRGTSTYDGISIAWSIAEYLHEHPQFKAKTLFATHYHELNDMTEQFKRIKNYNVAVKEMNEKVIFLRKLKKL